MLNYATDGVRTIQAFYPQDSSAGSCKRSKAPNKAGEKLEWWTAGSSAHSDMTERDRRYLAAYVEIGKQLGKPMYAAGFPFDDDYLWLDRAVITTLLARSAGARGFILTQHGESMVASVAVPTTPPA